MWSFCKVSMVTARKQHKCEYCGFTIEKGERYHRTSGMADGEFQSFIACERCDAVADFLREKEHFGDDEYTDFANDFLSEGFLKCPKCGSHSIDILEVEKNTVSYECEKCEASGEIDISLDALEDVFKQELGEVKK